ncbi:MAG: hypothetical protein HFE97_07415 [Oscillospiraceae bacterium]|nr:hypothetical protein [Oscillospiraceae bacterium]
MVSVRGVYKKAERCYCEAFERTRDRDQDGFSQVVRWETIQEEIQTLSYHKGVLNEDIKMLKESGTTKRKYEALYQKITELLDELQERQKQRT